MSVTLHTSKTCTTPVRCPFSHVFGETFTYSLKSQRAGDDAALSTQLPPSSALSSGFSAPAKRRDRNRSNDDDAHVWSSLPNNHRGGRNHGHALSYYARAQLQWWKLLLRQPGGRVQTYLVHIAPNMSDMENLNFPTRTRSAAPHRTVNFVDHVFE